jgi:hypothetical protein
MTEGQSPYSNTVKNKKQYLVSDLRSQPTICRHVRFNVGRRKGSQNAALPTAVRRRGRQDLRKSVGEKRRKSIPVLQRRRVDHARRIGRKLHFHLEVGPR